MTRKGALLLAVIATAGCRSEPPPAAPSETNAVQEPVASLWDEKLRREDVFKSKRPELFGELGKAKIGMPLDEVQKLAPAFFAERYPPYEVSKFSGLLDSVQISTRGAGRELLDDAKQAWGEPLSARNGKDMYWFNPELGIRAEMKVRSRSEMALKLEPYTPLDKLFDLVQKLGDRLGTLSADEVRDHFLPIASPGIPQKEAQVLPIGCDPDNSLIHIYNDGISIHIEYGDCPALKATIEKEIDRRFGKSYPVQISTKHTETEWPGPPAVRINDDTTTRPAQLIIHIGKKWR